MISKPSLTHRHGVDHFTYVTATGSSRARDSARGPATGACGGDQGGVYSTQVLVYIIYVYGTGLIGYSDNPAGVTVFLV